ncbi:hypothetical protein [Aestuariivirga sp.]
MREPDQIPTLAAGHAVIAGALGLSLVVMLPLAAPPAARLLAWLLWA